MGQNALGGDTGWDMRHLDGIRHREGTQGAGMGHEDIRGGQEPLGWDRRNQDGTWGTRTGHEELGWDRRWHRRSQEGTGTGGDRMGHKMGHGALRQDSSHWDGI